MSKIIYFTDDDGNVYDTIDMNKMLCDYYNGYYDEQYWYTPEYTTESWYGTIAPLLYAEVPLDKITDILCKHWPSLYEVWTDYILQYEIRVVDDEDITDKNEEDDADE